VLRTVGQHWRSSDRLFHMGVVTFTPFCALLCHRVPKTIVKIEHLDRPVINVFDTTDFHNSFGNLFLDFLCHHTDLWYITSNKVVRVNT